MKVEELFRKITFGANDELLDDFLEVYNTYIASESTDVPQEGTEIPILGELFVYSYSDIVSGVYSGLYAEYERQKKQISIKDELVDAQTKMIAMLQSQITWESLREEQKVYEEKVHNPKTEKSINLGYVYIAKQLNEKNVYKIGYSKDLTQREKTFKVGNAFVNIVASLITAEPRKVEKYIHDRLDSYNLEGEWYFLDKKLLNAILLGFGFKRQIEMMGE